MHDDGTDEANIQNNSDSTCTLYWLNLCKCIQCVTQLLLVFRPLSILQTFCLCLIYSHVPVFFCSNHWVTGYLQFVKTQVFVFLPTKTRKNSTKFIEWVVSLVWISFPCQHIRLIIFYWYCETCNVNVHRQWIFLYL